MVDCKVLTLRRVRRIPAQKSHKLDSMQYRMLLASSLEYHVVTRPAVRWPHVDRLCSQAPDMLAPAILMRILHARYNMLYYSIIQNQSEIISRDFSHI